MNKIITFVSLVVLCGNIYAQDNNTNNTQQKPTIYCPKVSQIVKTDLRWNSTTNVPWKGYEDSFVDTISSFAGAQWEGIKVGQMSCIYMGKDKNTFPVILQNNSMFLEPEGGNWSKGESGYFNCVSTNVEECPLFPKVKDNTPHDVSKILQGIK